MKRNDIKPSEITPEEIFLNRRKLLAGALAVGLLPGCQPDATAAAIPGSGEFTGLQSWPNSLDIEPTGFEAVTTTCNYYELGYTSGDQVRSEPPLTTDPWSIEITGAAERTGTFTLEDILQPHTLEERIYRFRCVEAWSSVVPWVGFPLADLIRRFEPLSSAKYVMFQTAVKRDEMPGLRRFALDWPYTEGLTIEEAMHPLTLVSVGMYGRVMPNQSGAPIRIIVPWKYGYKGAKSIVRIHFTDEQPRIAEERNGYSWVTAWNQQAPHEYGFYSNVNPNRPHPRWSQASERVLGGSLFNTVRQPTLMFNGYEEEVAHLYQGLDLIRNH